MTHGRSLILALMVAVASPALAQSPTPVGVLYPRTGPLAVLGQEIDRGIELARQFAPKLRFVPCDEQINPATAVECISKLLNQDKVRAIIGPVTFGAQQAVLPAIRDRKDVPLISLSAVPIDTRQRPQNFFRLRGTRGNALSVAADFIANDLKAGKVAVIGDASQRFTDGSGWNALFKAGMVTFDAKSFGDSEVGRFKSTAPAAVLLDDRLAGSVQVLRKGGVQVPVVIFTVGSFDSFRELKDPNVYIVAPPKFPTEAARKLHAAYEEKFKGPAAAGLLLQVVSAAQVLQAALQADGGVSVAMLASQKLDTALGSITFSKNGDAKGSGTGSTVSKSGASASTQTASTSCKCKDSDCCKTECCEANGCNSEKKDCKDVSCKNG